MLHRISRLALLPSFVSAAWLGAQEPPAARGARAPEIGVTASGTVSLSPDYAVVRVSVVSRDAQAARAGDQNARAIAAVRAALRTLLRVPDDSLPTVWYSVDTDYDRERRPSGYAARSTLSATIRDLTRVGAVIDAALGAGATNIAAIQFESTKRESARLEALTLAVRTARSEAQAIARAAGGSLGPLVEATTTPPMYAEARMSAARLAMAAPETPIAPPQLDVSATVTARWAFVQP